MKTGDQQFSDEPAFPAADEGSTPTDHGSAPADHPFAAIEATFKRAVAALDAADVPFLLGGSLACWAHGGAETRNDLDLMIKPADVDRAVRALIDRGMKGDEPPEPWLVKVHDGPVLVDLIHHPKGIEITDEVIARGQVRDVAAMEVTVMAPDDILVSKLLALGEHSLDLEGSLQIARSLREQMDWDDVAARTRESPYARAFLALVRELGIDGSEQPHGGHDRPVVRVIDDEGSADARESRRAGANGARSG